MSDGIKLVSGYIDLTVKYSPAWKQISNDFGQLTGGAKKAGATAGKAMSSSLVAEAGRGVAAAERKVTDALRNVEQSTVAVAKAKKADADATGRLALAEQKRAVVNANAKATDLQRAAAAEAVNRAKRAQALTSSDLTKATAAEGRAQQEQGRSTKSLAQATEKLTAAKKANEQASRGFKLSNLSGLSAAFAPLEQAGMQAARRTGSLMGSTLRTTLAGALGLGGAGLIGQTLFSGLDRLKTLQTANTQLTVMHKSAQQIKQITDDVTSVISGTPVKLDEAMNTVTQALGAGVKEGAQLKEYIGDIADAAGSAGKPFGQISMIFGQVLGKGKLMAEEIQQFEENGVHVRSALMNTFGWTGKELEKQVSKGKVTIKELQQAVGHEWGGLSAKMGDTFQGSVDKMSAGVARLGANFLGAAFGADGDPNDPLKGATQGINKVTDKLGELERWVGEHRDDIREVFENVGDVAGDVASSLNTVAGILKEHPGLIKAIPLAFIGWKSITGVTALLGTLKGLKEILTGIPGWTKTAGSALADMPSGLPGGAAGGKTPPVVAGGGSGALATILKWFPLLFVGAQSDQKNMRDLLSPEDQKAFDDAMARGDLGAANSIVQGKGGGSSLNFNPGSLSIIPQAHAAAGDSVFNPGPKATQFRGGNPGALGHYGLPKGSAINYGKEGFPDWVYDLGKRNGVEASTYAGHQENSGENQGIDWRPAGVDVNTPEGAAIMDKFAEQLMSMPGIEQVIWENQFTGKRFGKDPGDRGANQSIDDYYRDDWAGHRDHVHTRFSQGVGIQAPPLGSISGSLSSHSPLDPTGGLLSGALAGGTIGAPPQPAETATLPMGGLGASRNDLGKMLSSRLKSAGFTSDQILGILAMNQVESGGNSEGFLGFTYGQAANPQAAIDRFLNEQWMPRTKGGVPGIDSSGKVTNWDEYLKFLRVNIVGQNGVVDWQGNQQPPAETYQSRLSDALKNNRGDFNNWLGFSGGGSVWGAGTATSDSIPAMLSKGEHVLPTDEVDMMGGQQGVYAFRSALKAGLVPGFARGGAAVAQGTGAFSFLKNLPGFDIGGPVDPNAIRDAEGSLADLNSRVQVSQAQLNEVLNNPDSDDASRIQAQQAFDTATREFLQAQKNLPIIAAGGTPLDHPENQVYSADNAAVMAQAQLDALRERDDVPDSQRLAAEYELQAALRNQQQSRDDFLAGQQKDKPDFFAELLRTQGYIPAAAGSTGVAGTSSLAGILNLGNEAVGGLIDTGASLAQMAVSAGISAGTFGAGAAAGPAAGYGIQMLASTAKRGVSYGFQMASIGADSAIEQLFPFGAPHWLGYDYTGFAPQLGIQQALLTTVEKAGGQAIQDYFTPGQKAAGLPALPASQANAVDLSKASSGSGSGVDPTAGQTVTVGPTSGTMAPGPSAPPSVPSPPPGPGSINAAPKTGIDPFKQYLSGYAHGGPVGVFDQGGWLEPGGIAINKSKRVEPMPVFNASQWDTLQSVANSPAPELDPKSIGGGDDFSITLRDVTVGDPQALMRKIEDYQKLRTMRYRGRPTSG